jgi:molecular chaperone GrpE
MTNDENRPDTVKTEGTAPDPETASGRTGPGAEDDHLPAANEELAPEEKAAGGDEAKPEAEAEDEAEKRKILSAKEDSTRKLTKKEIASLFKRSADKLAEIAAENEKLKGDVKDLKDKWLRSLAEFENYRKRTRKEWELLQQRSKADIVLDVLSVVDDFERALSVVGDQDGDFVQGIRLIYNNLIAALEKLGVRKIDALNSSFDPTYHMAVAQIEREGAVTDQIVEVVQNGYFLGDFVVRPAKVVIAK